MSRKFAAFIATGAALVVVAGALLVLALGHERQPHPAAATTQTSPPPNNAPASEPSGQPTQTPSAPPATPGKPAADPTAGLVKDKTKKVLFFSFDDGPDPYWTPKILQVLAKHNAHATFFQLGKMEAEHPGLREQVLASGNAIGSHSISHPQLTAISAAERHHQIFDGPKSTCFRPPYGASNPKVRAEIKAAGMVEVLWDVDPRDWARPGVNAIVQNIMNNAHNHNIILMHDGGGDRGQTVLALDKALTLLAAKGYSFLAMDCKQP